MTAGQHRQVPARAAAPARVELGGVPARRAARTGRPARFPPPGRSRPGRGSRRARAAVDVGRGCTRGTPRTRGSPAASRSSRRPCRTSTARSARLLAHAPFHSAILAGRPTGLRAAGPRLGCARWRPCPTSSSCSCWRRAAGLLVRVRPPARPRRGRGRAGVRRRDRWPPACSPGARLARRVEQLAPVVAFLVTILVVSDVCARAGVFSRPRTSASARGARASRSPVHRRLPARCAGHRHRSASTPPSSCSPRSCSRPRAARARSPRDGPAPYGLPADGQLRLASCSPSPT